MTLDYYHIWMEGFSITGTHQKARCITELPILASNFSRAVKKFKEDHPEFNIEKNKPTQYSDMEAYKKRSSNWSIWGCNLYPDETTARESFG